MDTEAFYTSPEWATVRDRILARDGYRCTVSRLLGGYCDGPLHVHHIEKVTARPELALDPHNLATTCARHHPQWEAVRLFVERARRPLPPCRHRHPYKSGQEACDRDRAKRLGIILPGQEERVATAA